VIGGPPAAAVVFAGEVQRRTDADERLVTLRERIATAEPLDQGRLRTALAELRSEVRAEKLGEVAAEFDRVHSIERARQVGSVDQIVAPGQLRAYLIEAVERGMARITGPAGVAVGTGR
jgi:hypothetical protein